MRTDSIIWGKKPNVVFSRQKVFTAINFLIAAILRYSPVSRVFCSTAPHWDFLTQFLSDFQIFYLRGCPQTMLTRLAFFDHLPPCVDIFYGINVDKKWTFFDHLPASSCKCSFWTTPNMESTTHQLLQLAGVPKEPKMPEKFDSVLLLCWYSTILR
jgi:hypothetical protein